jgi:hypothetical protein
VPLAVLALRTAVDREAALTVAGPLGGGEAWSASWRWWERRPRVGFGLAAAAPFGGVWQVEAFDERQSYGGDPGIATQRRRSVAIAASDWATATTRWEARASVDRWPSGKASAFGGSLERRVGRDRGALRAAGAVFAGAVDSWTIGVTGAWRSGSIDEGTVWSGRAGFEAAGDGAPLAVWPGAGTGHAREALLRAHPLLRDGVVAGGVFGRRVAHAGIEWTRWRARRVKTLRLAPAVFLDIARAGRAPDFADDRPHADLGAGLRVAVPAGGILRVDVARGLRDGEMALSFGWSR